MTRVSSNRARHVCRLGLCLRENDGPCLRDNDDRCVAAPVVAIAAPTPIPTPTPAAKISVESIEEISVEAIDEAKVMAEVTVTMHEHSAMHSAMHSAASHRGRAYAHYCNCA